MAQRRKSRPLKQGSRLAEATIASATDGLDDKERLFVYHYITTLDAQHAALLAGYSATVAKSSAYQWVNGNGGTKAKARIYDAVHKAMTTHFAKLEITAERVLQGLAEIAFSNVQDFGTVTADGHFHLDLTKATRAHFAAVQELSVHEHGAKPAKGKPDTRTRSTKLKLAEKRPALVDLGRHLGVFKEDGAAAQTVTLIIKGAD